MSRCLAIGLVATLALALSAPVSARPFEDGGMLGGIRLGGPAPESQSPGLGEGLVKNSITFVLGSDGPGPSMPPEARFEFELPAGPVDDSAMLFAHIEGEVLGVPNDVPEPTSMLMLGSGLLVAARRLRRR